MNGVQVTEAHAEDLIRAVSDEEIKETLFSIGDDKSPGPDGQLLKQMNHSIIALVPKSKSASRVEDCRPIACCNVFYKVISKILVARLSSVMSNLIDLAQAAFVQGRAMTENVYLVQKLLKRYSWSKISPRCILKVDFRKAFDSLNWIFIKDVLIGLGFPNLFVEWIM
ncbi:hypothetical protein Acr_00g0011750 [Actinidia rufa]|uniref:Reverse transcriptase domain-containing protein n=1 Tax=Actinidia rufa TaxID=165716 RepID=A0A7J0DB78_9ERIC|nr:hypothetical protein Acr_00g0011750 [Actinidia rufa]